MAWGWEDEGTQCRSFVSIAGSYVAIELWEQGESGVVGPRRWGFHGVTVLPNLRMSRATFQCLCRRLTTMLSWHVGNQPFRHYAVSDLYLCSEAWHGKTMNVWEKHTWISDISHIGCMAMYRICIRSRSTYGSGPDLIEKIRYLCPYYSERIRFGPHWLVMWT